jgi:hypothetical protein
VDFVDCWTTIVSQVRLCSVLTVIYSNRTPVREEYRIKATGSNCGFVFFMSNELCFLKTVIPSRASDAFYQTSALLAWKDQQKITCFQARRHFSVLPTNHLTMLSSINYFCMYPYCWEPGTSISIVSGYGLDDRAIQVRSPAETKDFPSNLWIQTGTGAHPASCTMGTGGPFPGVKSRRGVTLITHPHI